jgi:hypothetical protein
MTFRWIEESEVEREILGLVWEILKKTVARVSSFKPFNSPYSYPTTISTVWSFKFADVFDFNSKYTCIISCCSCILCALWRKVLENSATGHWYKHFSDTKSKIKFPSSTSEFSAMYLGIFQQTFRNHYALGFNMRWKKFKGEGKTCFKITLRAWTQFVLCWLQELNPWPSNLQLKCLPLDFSGCMYR